MSPPGHPTFPLDEELDVKQTQRGDDSFVRPVEAATSLRLTVRMGEVLGTGGMAVVREAEQISLHRAVAIKSPRKSMVDPKTQQRLVTEARITGALEHPSILPVHDILKDEAGTLHILMKRVDGKPWTLWMHNQSDVKETFGAADLLEWNLDVLDAVCNALHFAHANHIVHRDLKPDNVMVAAYGQVYVLDWGIAVTVDPNDSRFPLVTTQRRLAGTPRYMAPEMLTSAGLDLISPRTDVYLLGAILVEILTGHAPHRGFDIREILASIPDYVPSIPEAPQELEAIVKRAMACDPSQRYESAEEFRRALREFRTQRGGRQLAEKALDQLQQLETVLADPDANRIEIYDRFGATRFGFLESLTQWPDNPLAREGLQRSALLMARWELDQDDDRAAEILLGQLATIPSEFADDLKRVRSERIDNADLLRRLTERADPNTGARARAILIAVMTVCWAMTPVASLLHKYGALTITFLLLFLITALVVVGRERVFATRRNRITAALVANAVISDVVLTFGTVTGALDQTSMLHATWAANVSYCTIAALILDWRMLFPAVAYTIAYLLSPQLDSVRPFVAASLNLFAGFSGLFLVMNTPIPFSLPRRRKSS